MSTQFFLVLGLNTQFFTCATNYITINFGFMIDEPSVPGLAVAQLATVVASLGSQQLDSDSFFHEWQTVL